MRLRSKYQLGLCAIVALVGLRLLIGAHFYVEGMKKFQDPKPFSGPFLSNAKGPVAGFFQAMIWDGDGRFRLDEKATIAHWEGFSEKLSAHYEFSEVQTKKLASVTEAAIIRLQDYFYENRDDILQYLKGLDRRDENLSNPARQQVKSLRGQVTRIEGKRRGMGRTLLASVNLMWTTYEREANALATEEQAKQGRLVISKPDAPSISSDTMDRWVPYFDFTIGVLLFLGLFTRVAGTAAALFLLSIIASQWPGTTGAVATWPQAIEMFALWVLIGTGAGRFAGVDGIIHSLLQRCCSGRAGATQNESNS